MTIWISNADVLSRHSILRAECDVPILPCLQYTIRHHFINKLGFLNQQYSPVQHHIDRREHILVE